VRFRETETYNGNEDDYRNLQQAIDAKREELRSRAAGLDNRGNS